MTARSGIALKLGVAVMVLLAGGCTSSHGKVAAPATSRAAASLSVATRFPDPKSSAFPAVTTKQLQAVIAEAVADHALTKAAGAPGVTAAVLSDQGAWAGAAGKGGDGARLTPDAMMAIDSITKTFVAAELMRLAERGKVDLEAPLSTYVSHSLTANGATVRQALSMRSGLSDPPGGVFDALVSAKAYAFGQRLTARQILAHLKPRSSPPGGIPVYANVNYLLLGMVIERVTGRALPQVERADLFRPAGLVRVAAQDAERPTPPLAAPPRRVNAVPDGYLPSRAWARWENDSFAGIAADAPTVAKWGYQLYGGRLLTAESLRAMTSQPSADSLLPSVGYGLGTMIFMGFSTDPAYGHLGRTQGYTSLLAVTPARHLAVAVLIPEGGRDPEGIMRDLLAILR